MLKNTVCYSIMPITVQAGLRVRKLALHSNRSYCFFAPERRLRNGILQWHDANGTPLVSSQ